MVRSNRIFHPNIMQTATKKGKLQFKGRKASAMPEKFFFLFLNCLCFSCLKNECKKPILSIHCSKFSLSFGQHILSFLLNTNHA